jgi:hypothetical protein
MKKIGLKNLDQFSRLKAWCTATGQDWNPEDPLDVYVRQPINSVLNLKVHK